jgi:uncharacterized protein (DUF58 family)
MSVRQRLALIVTFPARLLQWMMMTRPIRFTRFGTFYVLFALAVGAAAINTGNNLLYLVLGVLLGFIVVSGFLSDSCLWGLEAQWHLIGSAYAGKPVSFDAEIKKSWFPAVLVAATPYFGSAAIAPRLIYWLGRRKRMTLRFTATPSRRGRWKMTAIKYTSRFPFGLFEKQHTLPQSQEWIVYPPVEERYAAIDLFERSATPLSTASIKGSGDVPFFVRDYRVGDSPRYIHWKSTAKRQRLMIHEMEANTGPRGWLYVSSWPRSDREGENFISFVASLVFYSYREGRPLGLVTPEAIFEPDGSRIRLEDTMRHLALVDLSAATAAGRPVPPEGAVDLLTLWKEQYAAGL